MIYVPVSMVVIGLVIMGFALLVDLTINYFLHRTMIIGAWIVGAGMAWLLAIIIYLAWGVDIQC